MNKFNSEEEKKMAEEKGIWIITSEDNKSATKIKGLKLLRV